MQRDTSSPVLVTGASGYVATHVIKLLLEQGYKVRGTVRSLANKDRYSFLYDVVPEKKDNLELVEGDLCDKAAWPQIVEGCKYVFHIASPLPHTVPKDDMEIIGPAVAGTENVLEAAVAKGVKKVVVTSSAWTAMMPSSGAKQVTEEDWSDETLLPAYPKSKVLAEKRAWKFYEEHKDKLQVTIVLPGFVVGPVYAKQGNSAILIKDMLEGSFPGVIDIALGCVDVRDVAVGHVNAMFNSGTDGRRYIVVGEERLIGEMLAVLKKEFGKVGYKVNDHKVTDEEVMASGHQWAQRLVFMSKKPMAKVINERSKKELGIQYTPFEQTITDQASSLIKLGIVKQP